ncbi:MAG TPA: filamentous hemagglutinin N-terminal domain-containing protein, partial [Desulfuromonadaceae bacterium]
MAFGVTAVYTTSLFAAPLAPNTLPGGGQVVAGQGSIGQSGSRMSITQSSQQAIFSWQTFNIGSQAQVTFIQPNSQATALNRVISSDPSQIYGSLTANGRVFLLNPSGIIFGPGSSVNVGGLVASTMGISDSDFLAGRYLFTRDGSTGTILNRGTITAADGGFVALLAPNVMNEGIVSARLGTVAFAAGDRVTLDFDGDNLVSVTADPATIATLVDNRQLVRAEGGRVIMAASAADKLLGGVVNNSGTISASSMVNKGGEVWLTGDTVTQTGNGIIEARGTTGGTVRMLGDKVGLLDSSKIDASGASGGGTVLVGGNSQGKGPEQNASVTYVGKDASIAADAVTNGNGGKVVVWADDTTRFHGSISAKGGAQGGDGGNVEVSGKKYLVYDGGFDARAPKGHAGSLL